MPEVNGKKFPYTKAGIKAAKKAKKEINANCKAEDIAKSIATKNYESENEVMQKKRTPSKAKKKKPAKELPAGKYSRGY